MWNARAHEAKRVCSSVKHTFINGGENKRWSPLTPKCTPTLEVALVWEFQMLKAFSWKCKKNVKLGPQDTIEKVLKCRCLKCPHIVHLSDMHML